MGTSEQAELSPTTIGRVVWTPPSPPRADSTFGRYLQHLSSSRDLRFVDYQELHAWSVAAISDFWTSVWEFFDVHSHTPHGNGLADPRMPGAVWFPGATLNYAEHALRHGGTGVAVVERSQTRGRRSLTWDELRTAVGRMRAALVAAGVVQGDRVATYCPTIVEALIVYLATVSIGAVYSSCPVEFGIDGVVSRLGQIRPTVLVGVDGYRYGSREISRRAELAAIQRQVPSIAQVVVVPYLGSAELPEGGIWWDDFVAGHDAAPEFTPVAFDHPLVIVYSSGTTGPPKPIVHGHGGVLVEHLKSLGLQFSMGPDDRFFWHTTTGWMMWNYLVAGLLVGAGIVLFDGDPSVPDHGALWRMAEDERITVFGTSPRFLLLNRRAGIRPGTVADLSALRVVGSTGSPLDLDAYDWFYEAVSSEAALVSGSGGTDVLSGLVGGAPNVPVHAGEISCAALGVDVDVIDTEGRPVRAPEGGELVVRQAMPSMPVGFWNDADGTALRNAYFAANPGMWTHGDWAIRTDRGSFVITGRSDATLNRGGVRIGTAELYSIVDDAAGVRDSLVVSLEGNDRHDDLLVLFVALDDTAGDVDTLAADLSVRIRRGLSPRHVPDRVVALDAVPRTSSGKKAELPVKRLLQGRGTSGPAGNDSVVITPATAERLSALRAELNGSGLPG